MREKKADVVRLMIELAKSIDKLGKVGLSVDGQVLLDLEQKLENDNFKVLVIGEFKNGKSTFINSLMGEELMPKHSKPCTAVITEVKYGKEKSAMLYFKNPLPEDISIDTLPPEEAQHIKRYEGRKIPPIEIDVAELNEHIVIKDKKKNQAESIKESPYLKVVLQYPISLCKDGIVIVDSPGLNENATRTKVTEEYLKSADAIVFVCRCPKIMGESGKDYVENQIRPRGYRR